MNEKKNGVVMALAVLSEAFGVKELSPARIRIYSTALAKIPAACLRPMTERAISTRRPRWGDLPTIAELLEDAEYARVELIRSLGNYGCASCDGHAGWIAVRQNDGTARMDRCGCWRRHQAKLVSLLGGDHPPSALPPAREWQEEEGHEG